MFDDPLQFTSFFLLLQEDDNYTSSELIFEMPIRLGLFTVPDAALSPGFENFAIAVLRLKHVGMQGMRPTGWRLTGEDHFKPTYTGAQWKEGLGRYAQIGQVHSVCHGHFHYPQGRAVRKFARQLVSHDGVLAALSAAPYTPESVFSVALESKTLKRKYPHVGGDLLKRRLYTAVSTLSCLLAENTPVQHNRRRPFTFIWPGSAWKKALRTGNLTTLRCTGRQEVHNG